jgi:hypothetical protein
LGANREIPQSNSTLDFSIHTITLINSYLLLLTFSIFGRCSMNHCKADSVGDIAATKILNREQYVNDVEAARILSVSPQTLRNYRCLGGKGPAYSKRGRMIRYRVGDLLDFMAAGRIDPEARHEAVGGEIQGCALAGQ